MLQAGVFTDNAGLFLLPNDNDDIAKHRIAYAADAYHMVGWWAMTGNELRRAQDELGMSNGAMCEFLGVTEATLCNWKGGRRRIPHIVRFAIETKLSGKNKDVSGFSGSKPGSTEFMGNDTAPMAAFRKKAG